MQNHDVSQYDDIPEFPAEGWSRGVAPIGDIPDFLQSVGAPEGLTFEMLAEKGAGMAEYMSIEEFCLEDFAGEIAELMDEGRIPRPKPFSR